MSYIYARDLEATKAPDTLQNLRDAMSKADYRGAITTAGQLNFTTLSPDQLKEVVFVLFDAAQASSARPEDELAGYDLLLKAAEVLDQRGAADPRVQESVARALAKKGVILGLLKKLDEAILVYDELLRRFNDSPEPALREQVVRTLVNKGVAFGQLNRPNQAIDIYDTVLQRFSDDPTPTIRLKVATALYGKAYTLGTQGKIQESSELHDILLQRIGDSQEPAFQETIALARSSAKASPLTNLAAYKAAIVTTSTNSSAVSVTPRSPRSRNSLPTPSTARDTPSASSATAATRRSPPTTSF